MSMAWELGLPASQDPTAFLCPRPLAGCADRSAEWTRQESRAPKPKTFPVCP